MSTPYMNLTLPTPSVALGPAWAATLNTAITSVDSHNHTTGQGQQVPTAGININLDLPFNSFNATQLRSARFSSQGSTLSLGSDANCVYVSGGNLYYNNGAGQAVQITSGASLSAVSLGAITGLAAPASAAYSVGSGTYTWQSNTNVAATMDMGPVVIRDTAASALGITIKSPTSLAGAYSLTLPAALPGSTKILTLSATGAIAAAYDVDNSTLQVSGNTLSVKSLGITAAQIANGTIGSTQVGTLARSNLPSVGQQVSSSSASFGASGVVAQSDVTNLTLTITTTGRPVLVIMQPDGTGNAATLGEHGAQTGNLYLVRSGTTIAKWSWAQGTAGQYDLPFAPIYLDAPSAGTYTYKIQFSQASGIADIFNYVLVAFEL